VGDLHMWPIAIVMPFPQGVIANTGPLWDMMKVWSLTLLKKKGKKER